MELRKIDDGSIEIFGYVNITERRSKIIRSKGKTFREEIRQGAWRNAINRNSDIKLLVNHSWDKIYGSTKDNLKLTEDAVGAKYSIRTSDDDLIKKAENGEFKGLSFAFNARKDTFTDDGAVQLRSIEDMDVTEISLLTVEPAYDGCIVECRGKDGVELETRDHSLKIDTEHDKKVLEELRLQKEKQNKLKLIGLELEI